MKTAARALVALTLVAACATQARAQTADDVIAKAVAAMGGRAAISKIRTRAMSGTISLSKEGFTFAGPIEAYNKAPNKSRIAFRLDLSSAGQNAREMVVDTRCDGTTAFMANNLQGDRELTGEELQDKLNAVFPSSLLTYKQAGAKVELVGKDNVAGRDVYVVLFTPKAGPAARLHFDAANYLLLRAVATIHETETGGNAVDRVTDYLDYRDVDGMKVPFGMKVTTGGQTIDITFTKVEHNTPIDDAMFARPTTRK